MNGIRIGRDPMTDEIRVSGYEYIKPPDKDECSFCSNPGTWSVAGGELVYCSGHRVSEAAENHAFWFDMDVIAHVEITTGDFGIYAEAKGWRNP